MREKFPFYKQADSKDCGATCLKIIAKHYGKTLNIQTLRSLTETTREGSNLMNISDAAEKIGFKTLGVKINLNKLEEAPLPCILHWNKEHYVVLYQVKRSKLRSWFRTDSYGMTNGMTNGATYFISDPAIGLIEYSQEEFLKCWIGNNANETTEEGIALLLEPTIKFHQSEFDKEDKKAFGFALLFKYLIPYKSFVIQLAIGLLAGSLLQLIVPFLTQSIVDVGIQNQDLNFIYLVLIAQISLSN